VPPEVCPICGADVPRKARACPECGADERSGWSAHARYDGLDVPDADEQFDYDDFVKREFGGSEKVKLRHLSWFWWVVAVIVFVALAALFFVH